MNWRVREKANRFRRYARERVLLALKGVPPEAFTLYMALFIVQGVNFLLLPLLSRKLGVQGFGFYSMLLSLALLGQTIIEYGSLFWGLGKLGGRRTQVRVKMSPDFSQQSYFLNLFFWFPSWPFQFL